MAASAPALSSPQRALIDAIAAGPRRTKDLVRVSGKGRTYVRQSIRRLNRRWGCDIRRLGPQQSHHGAVYVAVSIPWLREVLCSPRCVRCGGYLAKDHEGAELCSPCSLALGAQEAS